MKNRGNSIKFILYSLAIAGVIITQFSCASLAKKAFKTPVVKVEKVILRDVSFAGTDLDVVISVDNPNVVGITLNRLEYELYIEGEKVITGIKTDKLQIAAKRKSEFTIPVEVFYKGLKSGIMGVLNKDKISYEFKSLLTINTPIMDLTFRPKASGDIPIPKRPHFNVEKIETDFSFSEVNIVFFISLSNNDEVKLDIRKMNYSIKINGENIANSFMSIQKNLGGKNEKLTYKIPVTLKLLQMKKSLISAIKSGKFRYQFNMNMELNSKFGPYQLPYNVEKDYELY